jgi:hypothetical protein
MRPTRLLLSLGTSLVAITLLLYVAFGSHHQDPVNTSSENTSKSRVNALFSFASPASLFPPSAIISLTDDNSTFFLARPAAFGPLLPESGLSGPLWVGSGFGDEAMGTGELGCSDVPGWNDGDDNWKASSKAALSAEDKTGKQGNIRGATRTRRTSSEDAANGLNLAKEEDGTDDHLHEPSAGSKLRTPSGITSKHADIKSLQEGAEIAGKVVLLKRGGCGFLEKTKWAQSRGGVALIVGDDVRGGPLIVMNARADTSNISIPALFTSHTTAHLLSSLLPSGSFIQDLSPEDAAKLELIKSGKGSKHGKNKSKSEKSKAGGDSPSLAQSAKEAAVKSESEAQPEELEEVGWLRSVLYAIGIGKPRHPLSKEVSQHPPSSGGVEWVQVEDWQDDRSEEKLLKAKVATASPSASPTPGDFIIGEQDWRDPDLLPLQTSSDARPHDSTKPKQGTEGKIKGEYNKDSKASGLNQKGNDESHEGWVGDFLGHSQDEELDAKTQGTYGSSTLASSNAHSEDGEDDDPIEPSPHEGLWVTLAPTNMSSSPFFDTLLVLVVSPLVTLTVVYALLLLRSRIRRRRWRAPKSVVERLPVRTYQTISDASSNSTPTATPNASSPTTPLLQHSHSPTTSRPTSSLSRPRSRTTSEVPATSSAVQASSPRTEEEKRESGLAEWRRRYGGRQRECVVCLEEYIDGVSRVMSLPCGHEFHADCITPWLVTRRRTCPICKGDVVRSLSQSYRDRRIRPSSPAQASRFQDDSDLQEMAAETRNDSPSASQPVPISSSSAGDYRDELDADVEANWAANNEERGSDITGDGDGGLSSSVSHVASSVSTTIWLGVEAVRSAAGLQRRSSQDVDRDR